MSWEEMLERFREALRAEARKRWGHIGWIEQRAGMRRGRISDVYSGRVREFPALLHALDALEINHGAFFSQALGWHQRPEEYLAVLEVGAETDDAKIVRLERATYRLEVDAPPQVDNLTDASDAEGQLEAFLRCNHREQARRLRETRAYGTHAFARAYLEHLDSLRYVTPDEAAKLAAMVIFGLIPRLPAPQSERIELACWALGIYGSARRARGRFTATACVFRLGLELARRRQLRHAQAELLQRASYLLRDLGQFERALAYLSEALAIFVVLDDRFGMGKTLVDRGMMLAYQGAHNRAIDTLQRALQHLGSDGAVRNRCAAHQYLAYAWEQLGELTAAEHHLRQASGISKQEGELHRGKLLWLEGSLALRRRLYERAEKLLRKARSLLTKAENPGQEALVSLDLLDVLIAQGEAVEACELAQGMVHLLEAFEANRLASQAIIKLVRPALAGRISRTAVTQARTAVQAMGNARADLTTR